MDGSDNIPMTGGSPGQGTAKGPRARPDLLPPDLLESVRAAKCILFLGAMVSAPSSRVAPLNYITPPPSGGELSRRLARQCSYPYEDDYNLQRVSLYFQYKENFGRNSLIGAMQRGISAPGVVPSP